MTSTAVAYITEDEYIRREETAEYKNEYYNGRIYAMSGGTPEHALISGNVLTELGTISRGGPCRVYASQLRIRVTATGLNTYPDATVVCGDAKLTRHRLQAVTNPTAVVEVLSKSTIDYDRGEKWAHYQSIESLQEYMLVWQDRPRVERFKRESENRWEYEQVDGLGQMLQVDVLGGTLSLSEVYRGVELPDLQPLRMETAEGEWT